MHTSPPGENNDQGSIRFDHQTAATLMHTTMYSSVSILFRLWEDWDIKGYAAAKTSVNTSENDVENCIRAITARLEL